MSCCIMGGCRYCMVWLLLLWRISYNLIESTDGNHPQHHSSNRHPRYHHITHNDLIQLQSNKSERVDRNNNNNNHTSTQPNYHVFIAITSSPAHSHLRQSSRNSWLIPCIISHHCEYKFFIDIPKSKNTLAISLEMETYQDIVTYRSSCKNMKIYHDAINYGNSPPTQENDLKLSPPLSYKEEIQRLYYKIDWKVS